MAQIDNEQHRVRRGKLEQLRSLGYPYPNDVSVTSSCKSVVEQIEIDDSHKSDSVTFDSVTLAGRLVSIRLMGKAAFCHIQDVTGKLQVYVRRDDVGVDAYAAFKTFDLGDIVEVSGFGFKTQTGEPSLHANSIRLLVKCLHPLPEKWHGLTDKEVRYRQRYLDLIVNPDVRNVFVTRARIIQHVRDFFNNRGYVEVETPFMSAVASGAAARPFVTHHNALDLELHLRIALELPLKRLIVGGLERVYELSRVFRNEGISTEHNPEFTMIEFYEAYATYETLMSLTENLVVGLCDNVIGSRKVNFHGNDIDFTPPWKRLTMTDAVYEFTGLSRDISLETLEGVHQAAVALGCEDVQDINDYGRALYAIYDRLVEDKIVDPTFIIKHPLSISPLARPSSDDPRFTDRFELIVSGMELANAFSELNDPDDQRERFLSQMEAFRAGEEEAVVMDEDFVTALEYGMPPTAGEGIGIDRLVMVLTGAASIRDVILFPLMRPQEIDG